MLTFTGRAEDLDRLSTASIGVTAAKGDEAAWNVGEALAVEMGAEPVRIPESARALYHAALAHGGVAIEDPAGWRKAPGNDRYLAYVRDPAGHKLCLMFREIWAQPAPAGTTA